MSPRSFILAAALLLAALAPAGASAAGFTTGVTNIGDLAPKDFQLTKEAGTTFVKIPLYWRTTVPTTEPAHWNPEDPSDPAYDWGEWDEAVGNAVGAGLTPVLQLVGPPTWAERCHTPSVFPDATCDPDPGKMAAFAAAVAKHFDGDVAGVPRVRYWQVLNEPNLSLYFFPQYETTGRALSADLYRPLLNASYRALKSVSKSNVVVLAGLGPIAVPKYTIGPMQFARELLCMKGTRHFSKAKGSCEGGVHFDVFAIQPYTTGAPTHRGGVDDVELGDLGKLQDLIKAADKAGRIKGNSHHTPLWVTEFSWDTKPPDPGGLPMKIETRWVAEALYVAWKAGVSNFFWFSLHDGPGPPQAPWTDPNQSGLYSGQSAASARPKPILGAFRFPFVAYPGSKGLAFWGKTPSNRRGKVLIQTHGSGGWKTVARTRADSQGIFKGTVGASSYGRDLKGDARALYGKARSVPFAMKPVPDFSHPPFG